MAKHTGTPKITVSDRSVYSAPCSRYGDGQCDGYVSDPTGNYDGAACDCSCHSDWSDCPEDTLANVAAWHAEQWRLFGPAENVCERHGGKWGDDQTCANCTSTDGKPLPLPIA